MNGWPHVIYDTRWIGPQGIARYSTEILRRLPPVAALPPNFPLFHPLDPLRLRGLIRRQRPDVYFSPGFNPPWRPDRPFVFTVHDLNYVRCRENSDALRRSYFRLLVKPACRYAAKVLTVSDFSRSEIIRWADVDSDQVVNVGNGVDPRFSMEGPKHSPGYPYVLYVGNRQTHKNLRRLLTAFAMVKAPYKLLLSGPPDSKLSAFADDLGILERIAFAGVATDEELAAIYRGASVVALPSLYEGFGLPIVEAMASGIPVLASNVTCLPEIAGDAALLIDPRSIEELASGLNRLLEDEQLRSQLIARGLARAKLYSWDNTAAKVGAILRNAA